MPETLSKYKIAILIAFFAIWIFAAINPITTENWIFENCLVLIYIPIMIITEKHIPLSKTSFTLIFIFLSLHIVGAHYSYGEVPFGFTLGDWLQTDRNLYDRFVHFNFGFLLAYPIHELITRLMKIKNSWSYYLTFDSTITLSALYEIFEWLIGKTFATVSTTPFLGTQGDAWDVQKDMAMAAIGSIMALIILISRKKLTKDEAGVR